MLHEKPHASILLEVDLSVCPESYYYYYFTPCPTQAQCANARHYRRRNALSRFLRNCSLYPSLLCLKTAPYRAHYIYKNHMKPLGREDFLLVQLTFVEGALGAACTAQLATCMQHLAACTAQLAACMQQLAREVHFIACDDRSY